MHSLCWAVREGCGQVGVDFGVIFLGKNESRHPIRRVRWVLEEDEKSDPFSVIKLCIQTASEVSIGFMQSQFVCVSTWSTSTHESNQICVR